MSVALEVLVTTALLVGVQALTLSSLPAPELGVAAAAAFTCALVAAIARRAVRVRWHLRSRWLGWLVRVPWAVATDTGRVLVRPLRRTAGEGSLRTLPLAPGLAGDAAAMNAAVATIALSAAPASYVVDSRDAAHVLLVHGLTPAPGVLERAVRS